MRISTFGCFLFCPAAPGEERGLKCGRVTRKKPNQEDCMIIESIKKLLGDDLAQKVEEALKGKGESGKDVDLVAGNDGSYVPKAKFDEINEKHKAADQLAKDTKKQLDGIKAVGDPAELKTQLETAQKAAKEAEDKHKADMAAKDLDFAIKSSIADAHDPALVAGLVDRSKLILQDGGKVVGLDEALKSIRTEKPFLFKADDGKPPLKGGKPGVPGAPGEPAPNKKLNEMTYAERIDLKAKNPELYKQLSGGTA